MIKRLNAAPAWQGHGLGDIHLNNINPGDISPSDTSHVDTGFEDTGFKDIESGGFGTGDFDQPTQRIDSPGLLVRDLGEQLAQIYLPPAAQTRGWQRLQDLHLEVLAVSTAFSRWIRQWAEYPLPKQLTRAGGR